jgi:hypothetical protein
VTTILPTPTYGFAGIARAHDAGQGGVADTYLAVISEVDEPYLPMDGRTGLPVLGGCRLRPVTPANAAALIPFLGHGRHDVVQLTKRQMAQRLANLIGRRMGEPKFAKMAIEAMGQADQELVADQVLVPVLEQAKVTVERFEAKRASRPPVEVRGYR